ASTAELLLEPRDALPDDDQYWLNLDARPSVRVLLVEPETTQIEALQPGYHLRVALGVIGQGEGGAVQVNRRRPEAVAPADFANADLVVLANVGQLNDERLQALESRIKSGAGLLVFLGPALQPVFYNSKLHNPLRPTECLLPRPLRQPANAATARGELARLTRIEWSHPLLAPLFDPAFGDFAQVKAKTYYLFGEAPKDDASQVLAWFEDTVPALIEHTYGAGRVLVFNTTANDEWSDLPRRNSFIPLLDQALNRLAGSRLSQNFHTGEMVAIAVPGVGKNATATITTPGGRSVTPVIQRFDAQTMVRLDSADEAGVYSLTARGEAGVADLKFVVHVGRGDSVVAKTDAATLRTWWSKADFELVHPDPADQPEQTVATGRVLLWPWLFGLAALTLLAEMYFVHRLCPVMNPAVAGSTVAQHGMIAPAAKVEVVP
ncbi:MAG: hypothetical protein EBS05_26040, partial [Proteobacteria bacterium]|nr:hypothetical protein [Pseudomonadota bacterium]